MVRVNTLAIALLGGAAAATAFSLSMSSGAFTNNNSNTAAAAATSRRDFLAKSAAVVGASSTLPKAAFADDDADPYADYITTESGMKYLVTKEGDGAVPAAGQTVKAHYTGKKRKDQLVFCSTCFHRFFAYNSNDLFISFNYNNSIITQDGWMDLTRQRNLTVLATGVGHLHLKLEPDRLSEDGMRVSPP